jgi:hypothetical protein
MSYGNTTHIKFGGYDVEGIEGNTTENLSFLKTKDNKSWAVEIADVSIGDTHLSIGSSGSPRYALFELAFPYIYVPTSDFQSIATAINNAYSLHMPLTFH